MSRPEFALRSRAISCVMKSPRERVLTRPSGSSERVLSLVANFWLRSRASAPPGHPFDTLYTVANFVGNVSRAVLMRARPWQVSNRNTRTVADISGQILVVGFDKRVNSFWDCAHFENGALDRPTHVSRWSGRRDPCYAMLSSVAILATSHKERRSSQSCSDVGIENGIT